MAKKLRATNDNAKGEAPSDPRAVLERIMELDPRLILERVAFRARDEGGKESAGPMDLGAALQSSLDRKRREEARDQCVALINEVSSFFAHLSAFVQGEGLSNKTAEHISGKVRAILEGLDEWEIVFGIERDTGAMGRLVDEIEASLHYAKIAEALGLKYDPVADIRREYARDFPDLAAKLRGEDIRIALEVWEKRGATKKGVKRPEKSAHMVAMFKHLGIGNIAKPETFKSWLSNHKRTRQRGEAPIRRNRG